MKKDSDNFHESRFDKGYRLLDVKRLLDIIFSFICIIVFSPVTLIIVVLVNITIPGSVIFSQNRVGRGGKIFRILKFRTMAQHKSKAGIVVGIGGFLRRTKLDELPQLFNIFLGDMSFVGPRPYIEEEHKRLPDERLEMRPGLTGLAQVNGNTCLSWEERTRYDLEYVNNWSLGLDIRILLQTVKLIVYGEEACVRRK